VAGSNDVPLSGSHKKCPVRPLLTLSSIVGRCRSGANELVGRLGGLLWWRRIGGCLL
jgi:hypothetical protein